ncbi:MAG: alpha/beta hydrolase [Vampirovibrio sp.]
MRISAPPLSIEATLPVGPKNQAFRLTGLKASDLRSEDFGTVLVYVAGLGGSFRWAAPFWESMIQDGHLDTVIGIDLPSFGVNQHLKVSTHHESIQYLTEVLHPTVLKQALGIQHSKAWFASGISLGALSALHVLPRVQEDYTGILLMVPAFKGNTRTYSLPYIGQALWQSLTHPPETLLTLPYGIDTITQCPEAHRLHVEAHGSPRIAHPVGYMTSILPWQLKAKAALKKINRPVMMMTAGADFVVDTKIMHQRFKEFQPHLNHVLAHFPSLYHDVLLEPERHILNKPLSIWIETCKALARKHP